MYREKGIYVFPDGKKMRIFGFNGKNAVEFQSMTFAEQIIKFLDADIKQYESYFDEYRSVSFCPCEDFDFHTAEDTLSKIKDIANSLYDDKSVFKYLLFNEMSEIKKLQTPDSLDLARHHYLDILYRVYLLNQLLHNCLSWYCIKWKTYEEKINEIILYWGDEFITEFHEITFFTTPSVNMFTDESISHHMTKSYHFKKIIDFVWFLTLNILQNNANISVCYYCEEFFIPKTRKFTKYCDRV